MGRNCIRVVSLGNGYNVRCLETVHSQKSLFIGTILVVGSEKRDQEGARQLVWGPAN